MTRDDQAARGPNDFRILDGLDDPDAPPTAAELIEAEALRVALEVPASEEARFGEALRSAFDPPPLAPERLSALVEQAVDAAAPKLRGRVFRVVFGGVAAVAMAAAAALFLRASGDGHPGAGLAPAPSLLAARSSQDLFDEPFPRTGGTSDRIDRIASARARDLRENRYAAWGVR